MRVVHLVQTLVAGGAETMVRTLCPGLVEAGLDVRVVSVYPSEVDAEQCERLRAPVLEIGRAGRRDVGFFGRLVRTLRELRPDVVHGHVHTGQYAGRAAAIIAGVPSIVLTVHGAEPGGPVRWAADRVLHARTARFVVFSESQRRAYAAAQRVPLDRIVVIPNGVVPPVLARGRGELRAELGIPSGAFVFYSAARLAAVKNQRAAIDALALARAGGGADLRLVFAGTGPLADELRAHAAASGLGEAVRFLGHRADAPELLPAMDAFIYPSLSERMPMALGEAMLSGVAPVITPWDGYADVVSDGATALVAAGFDAPSIAAAMQRAAGDPAALTAIGAAARRHAFASFDVATMVRRHVEVYRALAAERAA
ncbi:MAG TPA: glycosyltransferase family 4 protein [Candidatus Elarobacter sp.]|jgi:glycosyltransferase involved in cell wall biosynthesis